AGEVPPDNAGTGRTQAGPAETAMSTGAAKSNAAENDADQDDADQDDAAQDGAVQDGAVQDGAVQDGAAQDDAVQGGAAADEDAEARVSASAADRGVTVGSAAGAVVDGDQAVADQVKQAVADQVKAATPNDKGPTKSASRTGKVSRKKGRPRTKSAKPPVTNRPAPTDRPAAKAAPAAAIPGKTADQPRQPTNKAPRPGQKPLPKKVAAARTADRKVATTALPAAAARPGATKAAPAGSLPVGSTRPAWRPMPLMSAKSNGVTIFGTTFTRRQTVIGGAVLLVILLVLALVIPKAFGSSDDKSAKGKATPRAGASATTTVPPTTAPTSAAPTSVSPASPPASGNTAVKLPGGWHIYSDQTGFKVPVPASWTVTKKGTETYFAEPGGQHRLLIVDQTNTPAPDPVADWTGKESDRIGGYSQYHRISIKAVNYWDKAADWEFTRVTDNSNKVHVVKRGFITAKNQAYGITWSTSDSDWSGNLDNLRLIYQGFIPKVS
ncbi:MAG: eukaryotic-like serine/threonine-protein kinase, partial [Actinoplanes sp.]|nr:eukaryotic-like serine/threonine-protein kinase [Actinoplanes sp.]